MEEQGQGQARGMTSIENIPPQMLLEIFSRLPIKSLCRMRCVCKQWYILTLHTMMLLEIFSRLPIRSLGRIGCVCKQWYNLTRDPSLHTMLLARPTPIEVDEEQPLILTFAIDYLIVEEEKFVDCTTYVRWMTERCTPPKPLFQLPGRCDIYHSFDGLLCIVIDSRKCQTVIISNPLTAEHHTLPPFIASSYSIFGLGFDSSIKKYKVLGLCNMSRRAQVYTIGSSSSSSWRKIKSRPTALLDKFKKSTYASGARHWLVDHIRSPDAADALLISFNFEKEEFKTLPCPGLFSDSSHVYSSRRFQLVDLRGYLGVIEFPSCRYIQIWKLKDYERNEWVREYRAPSVEDPRNVVGLWGEDMFVFKTCVKKDAIERGKYEDEDMYHQVLAYNFKTTSWRNIFEFEDRCQMSLVRGSLGIFLHKGSFVSLSS